MKRRDLIRHLEQHGCHLDREGGNHSIYRNPTNRRCAAVPRHREIKLSFRFGLEVRPEPRPPGIGLGLEDEIGLAAQCAVRYH